MALEFASPHGLNKPQIILDTRTGNGAAAHHMVSMTPRAERTATTVETAIPSVPSDGVLGANRSLFNAGTITPDPIPRHASPQFPECLAAVSHCEQAPLTNRTGQQLTHSQHLSCARCSCQNRGGALPDAVSESRPRGGQSQHLFSVKHTSSASTVLSRTVLSTPLRSCVVYPSCRVSYTLSF